MSITNYSELQTALGDQLNYGDSSSKLQDFIALCEAGMQVRLKLLEFETTATVTITNGSGSLPAGFLGARSAYWVGSPNRPIDYISPDKYDERRFNDTGDGYYYTITGSTIQTTPMGSGSVVLTYLARFTPLSNSNTTNAIITNFPDAYLYGSMLHGCLYHQDDAGVQKYGLMFNAAIDRIVESDQQRRYTGPLTVRTR